MRSRIESVELFFRPPKLTKYDEDLITMQFHTEYTVAQSTAAQSTAAHTLFENESITDINYPALFSLFLIHT